MKGIVSNDDTPTVILSYAHPTMLIQLLENLSDEKPKAVSEAFGSYYSILHENKSDEWMISINDVFYKDVEAADSVVFMIKGVKDAYYKLITEWGQEVVDKFVIKEGNEEVIHKRLADTLNFAMDEVFESKELEVIFDANILGTPGLMYGNFTAGRSVMPNEIYSTLQENFNIKDQYIDAYKYAINIEKRSETQ